VLSAKFLKDEGRRITARRKDARCLFFFEVRGIDDVFLQEIVQVRPVLPGKGRCAAYVPPGEFKEPDEISFLEVLPGFLDLGGHTISLLSRDNPKLSFFNRIV
jgi:hypothetical protein